MLNFFVTTTVCVTLDKKVICSTMNSDEDFLQHDDLYINTEVR